MQNRSSDCMILVKTFQNVHHFDTERRTLVCKTLAKRKCKSLHSVSRLGLTSIEDAWRNPKKKQLDSKGRYSLFSKFETM